VGVWRYTPGGIMGNALAVVVTMTVITNRIIISATIVFFM
jgi:hypothetical protein